MNLELAGLVMLANKVRNDLFVIGDTQINKGDLVARSGGSGRCTRVVAGLL